MLEHVKIQQAKRLLNEGRLSQRKIALAVGMSRASVALIATGKRPDYEALRLERAAAEQAPTGPPVRCAGCGGLVYLPCRLCRARQVKAQEEEARRTFRRRARELALRRLLAAIWRANQRDDAQPAAQDLAAELVAGGSDCK